MHVRRQFKDGGGRTTLEQKTKVAEKWGFQVRLPRSYTSTSLDVMSAHDRVRSGATVSVDTSYFRVCDLRRSVKIPQHTGEAQKILIVACAT